MSITGDKTVASGDSWFSPGIMVDFYRVFSPKWPRFGQGGGKSGRIGGKLRNGGGKWARVGGKLAKVGGNGFWLAHVYVSSGIH